MSMFPTWGPLPWVITALYPLFVILDMTLQAFSMFLTSLCRENFFPALSRLFPPRAMTTVSLGMRIIVEVV